METIDKIYCINLDSRTDRWITMQKYLTHFNVIDKVVRFSAKTGEEADNNGVVMHPKNSHHRNGAKGCAYSHYLVWMECLNKGYSRVLILEDDCVFSNEWINILNQKLLSIDGDDPNWHGLFLNFSNEVPIVNDWSLLKNQHLTGGYILSGAGLELMCRVFQPNNLWASDSMTWWLQDQSHCYGYYPWLIIQNGKDSNIQTQEHCQADHNKVLRLISSFPNFYYDY